MVLRPRIIATAVMAIMMREPDEEQRPGEQHADLAAEEGADHAGPAEDQAGAPADASGSCVRDQSDDRGHADDEQA